ncbi:MAG: DUF4301 family protein [Candidatus Kapaibacterium sp.]
MSITKELTIDEQLEIFNNGIKPVKIVAPCLLGDGITKLSEFKKDEYFEEFKNLLSEQTCIKFVPASGAATRMFSDLIALRNEMKFPTIEAIETSNLENKEQLIHFFKNLNSLPFYKKLKKNLNEKFRMTFLDGGTDLSEIIIAILDDGKLGLANKPKALIPFHNYFGMLRTPIYEHIQEAKEYILTNGVISIHFTVSEEHQKQIQKRINRIAKFEVFQINSSLSHQSAKTNTIAVDLENNIIEDENGNYITRPGGHGSLIFNLNNLEADVVFIKNIDNVITLPNNRESNKFKQMLAGYFYSIQKQLFDFARRYEANPEDKSLKREVVKFYKDVFFIKVDRENIFELINRPLRVCAMVKNEGQPGGGPYFVESKGEITTQILEASQIDKSNPENIAKLKKSTHFNPVDMICGITDYKGKKFNLLDFVDENTYFVSEKTYNGKPIKALELPGLWNGAMSDWNTVFVEMPSEYFNPVKTVFDLLDKRRIIK